MFKILKRDKQTKARLGVLTTPHGQIHTPAYVIVATHAQIKCLKPSDIKKTKTQVVIANTYHLWDPVKSQSDHGAGKTRDTFLTKKLGLRIPAMTDSGGFQVFSLAFDRHDKAGKIFPDNEKPDKQVKRKNLRITDDGVYFPSVNKDLSVDNRPRKSVIHRDREKQFLSPEISMKIQRRLGADIIFAFDECTSFFDDFKYNKKAMERTHAWALKCLKIHNSSRSQASGDRILASGKQMLFGIVQGGRYKSLRIKSAKFIGSLPFDGFGIGGSFGKEEMEKMLKWVIPHLPEEKPRHLLGIGKIEDVFKAVENGVDLFDCVIPTREGRHGRIWIAKGHYDIRKTKYANQKSSLEAGCKCPTCKKVTKSKLHQLFKTPAKLPEAQRQATIHNVWFFNTLLEQIRKSIVQNRFREFKKSYLTNIIR